MGVSAVPQRPQGPQANWERLTDLLRRCDAEGLKSLTEADLRDLQRLYRSASSDLSLARSRGQMQVAEYLNQLVGRAHSLVYARPPQARFRPGEFFGVAVPRTCKRNWAYWLASLLILVAAGAVGYAATTSDPAWSEVLVSAGMRAQIEPFVQGDQHAGEYFSSPAETLGGGGLSGFLMMNNIRVALMCFALGITAGVGTLYALVQNSLMLGSALGLGAFHDKLLLMISVVAPHGVVEISAIVVAAAAGLRLGYALVDPGDLLRRDALVIAAREAGTMAVGTIPMFIYAGLMEGLVSPQSAGMLASDLLRVAIGIGGGLILYSWLLAGDLIFDRTRSRKGRK